MCNDLTTAEASERVQRLLLDTTLSLARIKLFRSTNQKALEHGRPLLRSLFEDEAQKVLLSIHQDSLAMPSELATSPEVRQKVCRELADTMLRYSEVVTDAATLVFAHTLLDIHTTECLKILVDSDPLNWFHEVKGERVTLDNLHSVGADGVIRDEVRKYRNRLVKESITKRIEAIHRHCKPCTKHTISNEPYTYDADRLNAFDKKRHSIVHAAETSVKDFDLDSELFYLERTCIYLCLLVGEALSITWKFNRTLDNYFASIEKEGNS